MLPVIQIGPVAVQTAGLILMVGFWLALEIAGRQGARLGLDGGTIQSAGLYALLAGVVAARLAHVVRFWPVYREDLLSIVSLNPQTLSPAVGLAVGLLVAAAYVRRKQIPARPLLDAVAPGAALLAAALALANLANGMAFGTETGVPWGIQLGNARRHAVQLYEFAAVSAILGIVLRVGRRAPAPGLRFLLFVALYGGVRLTLEPLRATGHTLAGGIRVAQVLGLAATLVAMGLMRAWSKPSTEVAYEPAIEQQA